MNIDRRHFIMATTAIVAATALGTGLLSKAAFAQDSKEPITVLVALAQAGAYASFGAAAKEGAQLALDEINGSGGILSRPVAMTVVDTGGDPTKAVSLIQEHIAAKTPDLVVADLASAVALAVFPVTSRNEIVTLTMASSSKLDDPAAYPYGFSVTTRFEPHFELIASEMAAAGAKKAAAVLPLDAYGDNHLRLLTAALNQKNIELTEIRFDPKAVDVSPSFQKALDGKPDFIYTDTNGAGVPALLEGRLKGGAASVPTFGGQGIGYVDILKLLSPEALQNLRVLYYRNNVVDPNKPNPRADKLIADLKAKGSKLDQAAGTYFMAHDWLMYYKAAVEQAGTTDSVKVRDALESLKVTEGAPWVMWTNAYSPTSHFPETTVDDFVLAKPGVLKDGRYEISG